MRSVSRWRKRIWPLLTTKRIFRLWDYTYFLNGDGGLMEGISHEAASLAGHLKLGKLIGLYDSNDISFDGPTSKSFTEDVAARFEAYGWQHILVKDGNDLEAISKAIEEAKAETEKPTLIEIKTIIGFGAPDAGTHKVHGAPLGAEGVAFAKAAYGCADEAFCVPAEVAARFDETTVAEGQKAEAAWTAMFNDYKAAYPELAHTFETAMAGELPEGWQDKLPTYEVGSAAKASRVTSAESIQALSEVVPYFWGGSADLSSSNNTMIKGASDFEPGEYCRKKYLVRCARIRDGRYHERHRSAWRNENVCRDILRLHGLSAPSDAFGSHFALACHLRDDA